MNIQNPFYQRIISGKYYSELPENLKSIVIDANWEARAINTTDWIPIGGALLSLIDAAEKENLMHSGQNILNLGSGSGSAAIMWAHRGYDVIGIELNSSLAAISRKYIANAKSSLKGTIDIHLGSYYPKEYIDLRREGKSIATKIEEAKFKSIPKKTFHPICDADVYERDKINLKEIDVIYGYFWEYHFPSILEMFKLYSKSDAKLLAFGAVPFNDAELEQEFGLKRTIYHRYNEDGSVLEKIK